MSDGDRVRLPRARRRRVSEPVATIVGAALGGLLGRGWGALIGGVAGFLYAQEPESARDRREARELESGERRRG